MNLAAVTTLKLPFALRKVQYNPPLQTKRSRNIALKFLLANQLFPSTRKHEESTPERRLYEFVRVASSYSVPYDFWKARSAKGVQTEGGMADTTMGL